MAAKFRDFASRDWDPQVTSPAAAATPAETGTAEPKTKVAGTKRFGMTSDDVDAQGIIKTPAMKAAEEQGTTVDEVNKATKVRNAKKVSEPKVAKKVSDDGYLESERQRLANARSAREYTAIEREVNIAREQRRRSAAVEQPSGSSAEQSPQQRREAERAERTRQRQQAKVEDIWQSHAHLLDSSAPKKEDLEAMASQHPLSSAGASSLMGAAQQIHAGLSSFIRNPGPHLERSAGVARTVADKISKVMPDHPYVKQLHDWADTVSSPSFIKNVADKIGGGRNSANDALVNAGSEIAVAQKSASQNSEVLVSGHGTTRPVFTVANPSEQVHTKLKSVFQKLKTVHSKIQSSLPDGVTHPVDHVLMAAGRNRAESLVGEKQIVGQSSPDIDPVTGAESAPDHIWDHTNRFKLGSEAGIAAQIKVTPENHEMLKKRGVEALTRTMATKLAEKRTGIARGERGATAKIALSPTRVVARDVATQQGQEENVVDVTKLPEHHRAYKDTQGNYYHPQNEKRYRGGDVGPDNKPVQLSQTRYWKPVQE